MVTLELVMSETYGTVYKLVSVQTDGAAWPQPLISGLYLRKDAWEWRHLPDKVSIYMSTYGKTGKLSNGTVPGIRLGKSAIGPSLSLDLVEAAEYSDHIKYLSLQESRPRQPIVNGAYFMKNWFSGEFPPHVISIRLWSSKQLSGPRGIVSTARITLGAKSYASNQRVPTRRF